MQRSGGKGEKMEWSGVREMKWRGLDRKCNGQEWGEMNQKGQEGNRVKWCKGKWSCVQGKNRSGLVGNKMV